MLFFLSFLPVFIFMTDWNPEGEHKFITEKVKSEWYKSTETAASKFKEISSIDYWAKTTATRFKNVTEQIYYKTRNLDKSLLIAAKRYRLANSPDCVLWATKLNAKNGKFELYKSNAFCKDYGYIIRTFFKELYRQYCRKPNKLSSSKYSQRIKKMFGQMVTSFMFKNSRIGIPTPVVYNNKTYILVCDFIKNSLNNKIIGGFILLFPNEANSNNLVKKFVKKYWNVIIQKRNLTPLFLSLSTQNNSKLDMNKQLTSNLNINILNKLHSYISSNKVSNDDMAQIRLPSEMIGQVIIVNNRFARFCILSHQSQSIGIILSEDADFGYSEKYILAEHIATGIILFWLIILLRSLIFKKPYLSLKYKFIMWFLAFSMVPVCMSIGAWTSLIQDSRESKVKIYEEKLQREARNIENTVARLQDKYANVSQQIANSQQNRIISLIKTPQKQAETLTNIYKKYKDANIYPNAIICVTQGGWLFSKFSPGSGNSFKKSSKKLIGNVFGRYLKQIEPELYEACVPKDKKLMPSCRVSVLADVKEFRVHQNIQLARSHFGKVSVFKLEDKNYLHYYKPIYKKNLMMALIVVLWDCSKNYESLLKQNVSSDFFKFNNIEKSQIDAVVYKERYKTISEVTKIGNKTGLKAITQANFKDIRSIIGHDYLTMIIPMTKLPGYILTLRSSLDKINIELNHEQIITTIALSMVVLMSFLGAWSLASWMTNPIKRLKNKLTLFRTQHKEVTFCEPRKDEIGEVSFSLDKMQEWLLERERLTSFVAPEVLDIISNGNLIKAGFGTFHEAVVLVSDIRSFTTISETYDEKEIFTAINTHLGFMATTVEKWGGSIDRFVGDAIWAVFYEGKSEIGSNKTTTNALNASVEMMRRHKENQAYRKISGKFGFDIGIGIAKGKVLAGVLGNKDYRLDFSVMGKAVQDAEEIESLSKKSRHTNIVLSAKVASIAKIIGLKVENIQAENSIFELVNLNQVNNNE